MNSAIFRLQSQYLNGLADQAFADLRDEHSVRAFLSALVPADYIDLRNEYVTDRTRTMFDFMPDNDLWRRKLDKRMASPPMLYDADRVISKADAEWLDDEDEGDYEYKTIYKIGFAYVLETRVTYVLETRVTYVLEIRDAAGDGKGRTHTISLYVE